MNPKHVAPAAVFLASDEASSARILATELGRKGIRIDAVAPCALDTPLARAVHTEGVRKQSHERCPQGFSSAGTADR